MKDFVGVIGVYGHVNDILGENMLDYAAFVEKNDLADIKKARAEGRKTASEAVEENWAAHDVSASLLDGKCGKAVSNQTHGDP